MSVTQRLFIIEAIKGLTGIIKILKKILDEGGKDNGEEKA